MRYTIIIVLTFIVYNSFSQTITFNKRVQIGCASTIFSGLEATDSCYYVTGFVRDSLNCNKSALFAKFDSLGNLLLKKIYPNAETWQPCLVTAPNNTLAVVPYVYDSLGMHAVVYHYNDKGNLIWSSSHDNPYIAGGFIRPDDMKITSDSGYLIVSSINDLSGVSDISILKLDKSGSQQWHITKGVNNYKEHRPCVYVDQDNSYVVGYMQDDLTAANMNYTIRSKLEKVDSAGNSIWTYQSPNNEQIHGVNDLIKSKDGGWVVASAWGSEHVWSPSNHQFLKEAYVYKLDSARNFLWGTKFHSDSYLPREEFTKIIELEDSSLVAFGIVERQHPQPNPTYNIIHGRIVKLSPQGDSLWSREYEYLTAGNGLEQSIYDAERTYDGGFLVCGEANGNTTAGGPYQQGWLLKLDEEGCLVPGCHIVSGVLPIGATDQIDLKLYPNPTTDYLNIHYRARETGEELTFSVLDIQGRVLSSYPTADISDKTYIVPVYDLSSGMYIVEVRRDGSLLRSEQFVKR